VSAAIRLMKASLDTARFVTSRRQGHTKFAKPNADILDTQSALFYHHHDGRRSRCIREFPMGVSTMALMSIRPIQSILACSTAVESLSCDGSMNNVFVGADG